MRLLRATVVLSVSLLYLAHVFQIADPRFWNAGLSFWLDPYFINVLLEHWYVSVLHASDPSSPPMFFPVHRTLGYSHGLILYAPFYVPLRLFLHPFRAYNWTVFLVMEVGILCLYVLLRKLRLSFSESLVLTTLFFTSRNVMNEPTSQWTQRASVFLIPPILLMLLVSARMKPGPRRLILAAVAGCLSTLLYVQDFYTAHFAALFVAGFVATAMVVEGRVPDVRGRIPAVWNAHPRGSLAVLSIAVLAAVWTYAVWLYGGGEVNVLAVKLRSHQWERPAAVAAIALLAYFALSRRMFAAIRPPKPDAWRLSVTLGAIAGAMVFLWIYLPSFLEHPSFPEDHLIAQLHPRYPSRWGSPWDFMRELTGYTASRSFVLVPIVAVVSFIPWFGVDRKARIYTLVFLIASAVVLLIPYRFPDFSVWRVFFEPLPGFGAIRDPKRIIYLYELAVVLAGGLLLARLPANSHLRAFIVLMAVFLIVTDRRPEVFRYRRPIAVYERWVAAPIDIDPTCRSFYIKVASNEYMSRFDNMWGMYSVDSLFVSLNHGIPTLNGYSAWVPEEWRLMNPQEGEYDESVQKWIDRHRLTRVCEFDIDARTMRRRAQIVH